MTLKTSSEVDSFITFSEAFLGKKVQRDLKGLYFTISDVRTYDWLQSKAPEGVRITWDCVNCMLDRAYIEEETK